MSLTRYFYPRSPCGERQAQRLKVASLCNFYPRSPCGERPQGADTGDKVKKFLSTLSLRRATLGAWKSCNVCGISIHALLAESDCTMTTTTCIVLRFLSTLSLRRATICTSVRIASNFHFYPRSPCGERRILVFCGPQGSGNFYPRSPCGERPPVRDIIQWEGMNFYPRSPCGERPILGEINTIGSEFLSTLSLRRATPG